VILEVRGLGVSFGSVVALDGVDLDVGEGERLALIGPNGSGKTTLFNAVSGVVRPRAGRVEFLGHDITHWSLERTARAGLVRTFQHDAVFPGLTVEDNVALPLSLRQSRTHVALPATIDELLEIAGLGGLDHEPAANLSYGNRRRLGVAIAVALNPVLVMLDEPAAGLNENETHALSSMLLELNRLGVTLIVIEHDMPFISSLCTRAVVLSSGSVIARGTPQEVRRDPAVVSAYLGGHLAAAV
jgi:ABC-type branched-subunit amino acid transport system ATPase component